MKTPPLTRVFIGLSALFLTAPLTTAQTPQRTPPGASVARKLPGLGEGGALDVSAERRLGDRIAQQLYRDPDRIDDPVLLDHVLSLWQPLLAAARARGDVDPELAERFAWEVLLARDRSINAFALPGGYLGVHLGLLAQVGSADELASVLAHELSHVSQRHISRLIAQQDRQAPWIVGAMILGALAASAAKNADIAQAAIVGSQAVAAQTQLNFSRDMEREADRVGHGVLTHAGFDGQGFVRMFNRLQQASRHNDDGAFPYLRSHPLTTERMADMKVRLEAAAPHAHATPAPATTAETALRHALAAARARVWAESDAVRWREWVQQALQPLPPYSRPASNAASPPTSPAIANTVDVQVAALRCAGALAALRLQDLPTAWRLGGALWQQVRGQAGGLAPARALLLEIAHAPGAWAHRPPELSALQVQDMARQALQAPDRASVLWGARVMLHQGQEKDLTALTQRLRWWVADHGRDAAAWGLLAQAWHAQQQPLRALRAEAEGRAAEFDWAGAIDRLRAAQDGMRQHPDFDVVEQSIIQARHRDWQARLQEEVQEKLPR